MTLLIAEDDAMLRESLVRLFQRHGYTVRAAATGNEAIRVLREDATIALVISDYYMPDGDGGHVLEFVQRRDPPRPTFIMITGQTDLKVGPDTPGLDAFLVKPFSVRDLVKLVRGYVVPG